MSDKIYGWKFLTPDMATRYRDEDFYYPAPAPGKKWSEWLEHPEPAKPDGKDCGPGRIHIMLDFNPRYAPHNWWPWFAEGRDIIGKSEEKAGVAAIRLRRVTPRMFWRIIRLGWCRRADLRGANLNGADLSGANLNEADLSRADLSRANLFMADLSDADLRRADLNRASLNGADLSRADLSRANLFMADLFEADLRGASLNGADLSRADLHGASLNGADLGGADLRGAYLGGAYLNGANLNDDQREYAANNGAIL